MDFSTVTKKLNSREYLTIYDFAYDIHLILANAMCYNYNQRSAVFKDATRLHTKFNEEFLKLVINCEISEFTIKLVRIISKLFKLEHSVIFKYPVPYEAMGLDKYLTIVHNPLDLGTIFSRIHKYKDFNQFMNDVNLVFENCMKFNPPGNPFYGYGEELKDLAKKYARQDFVQVCLLPFVCFLCYPSFFLSLNLFKLTFRVLSSLSPSFVKCPTFVQG